MPRNITVAQKRAPDFHKRDLLAQTNQTKYDCFFCMAQKTQKIFSQDLKVETKIPGTFFFKFYIALSYGNGKIREKNNLVKLELSKEIFLSPEYPDFGSRFQKFGKLISNYFYVV